MSVASSPDTLSLHLRIPRATHVEVQQGDYDFAWYAQWGLGIAFLGHHIVAVYSAERDTLTVGTEITDCFRDWAREQAELTAEARVVLLERGRVEANLSHAAEHASGAIDSL